MTFDSPRTTSTPPPTSLRTRRTPSRNLDNDINGESSTAASTNLQSIIQAPYTRAPSPIPRRHPSRPTAAFRDSSRPLGTVRATGTHAGRNSDKATSASSTGFWDAPWSSIQGLASQLLSGSDASVETITPHPPNRKRRPLAATHDRTTSAPPAQWGPSSAPGKVLGKGSQEARLAYVQAKKREGLLAANGHVKPNVSGHFKRRDSDERDRGSNPPVESEDRDMLVYLHRVKPQDTLAGVMIKYNCQPNIFRKTNRLWPNDSIQIRKVVMLPVEACGVKGRKLPDTVKTPQMLIDIPDDDFMPTPTHDYNHSWPSHPKMSNNQETAPSSGPSSPSISVTGPEGSEPEWKHDSWVLIDGFVDAVEIARLPRRAIGFFPRSRRKSNSYSDDISSPPGSSLDLPRPSHHATSNSTSSPRRNNNSRSSNSNFPSLYLRGPGGVGTLGKDVHGPGPAPDKLNKIFAAHLPNVAPRESFESTRSNASSSGIENVGGAIENWVRKMTNKAVASVQSPPSSLTGSRNGDVIELTDAFEVGREFDAGDDEVEEELRERFPPRGRVFEESRRKK
ncbi:MAG: hypothetical protein LQ337_003650 [Flavoplaca oasis]|nr:MAG: hypothetical protein LQ337_003650 [Flavoplaca oasis]